MEETKTCSYCTRNSLDKQDHDPSQEGVHLCLACLETFTYIVQRDDPRNNENGEMYDFIEKNE